MSCPLCKLAETRQRRPGIFARIWSGIQWLFPAALLALTPKCPLCVAAYLALFTGVGISVTTARWLQVLMLVLCLASLSYLTIKLMRRKLAGWRADRVSSSAASPS